MPTGRPRSPAVQAPFPGGRRRDPVATGTTAAAVAPAAAERVVGRRALLRTGLLAGAASALAGCGLLDGDVVPFGPEEPPPDTGDLAAALADEERLLAAHRAAAERHPDLAPRLVGVRADHEEHRRVLRALLVDLDPEGPWAVAAATPGARPAGTPGTTSAGTTSAGTPGSTRTGAPGSSPSGTPGATRGATAGPVAPDVPDVPDVPAVAADALAALVELERTASSARTEQAVTAAPSRAPLLGVLAASEAAHAAVLAA